MSKGAWASEQVPNMPTRARGETAHGRNGPCRGKLFFRAHSASMCAFPSMFMCPQGGSMGVYKQLVVGIYHGRGSPAAHLVMRSYLASCLNLSLLLFLSFFFFSFYSKLRPPESKTTAAPHKISPPPTPSQAMSSTTTPKRPRSPTSSSSSTTSPNDTDDQPSSTITHFLSSVRKSVTKRMRIGYDYLGGGGTTNGQTDGATTATTSASAAAATGGGGGKEDAAAAGAGGTTPHAHRATLPRKEFGATPARSGPGGIGSPPFASPPFASTSGGSGPKATKSTGSGSGSKVTRFADGKKTSDEVGDGGDGKLLVLISWFLLVGFVCRWFGILSGDEERGREKSAPEPLDPRVVGGLAHPRKREGWREIQFNSIRFCLSRVFSISLVGRQRRHRSRNESLSGALVSQYYIWRTAWDILQETTILLPRVIDRMMWA